MDRVDLNLKKGEVNVHLTDDSGAQWRCPECRILRALYDHQPLRRWRHLDTCQLRHSQCQSSSQQLPGTRYTNGEASLGRA